jgi:iron complex outermembrane receptor protein
MSRISTPISTAVSVALLAVTATSSLATASERASAPNPSVQAYVSNALHAGPIAPQSLSAALDEFATRTKLQVVYRSNVAASVKTKGTAANLSPEETLEQLLQGTGLRYEFINERTIAIRPAVDERIQSAVSAKSRQNGSMRVAQAGETDDATSERPDIGTEDAGRVEGKGNTLEEVVVTGSHIRGAQNLSSPIVSVERSDIERGGFSTTEQLVRSLPQNLSNISEATVGSLNGSPGVVGYEGAGINLRGLGGDSTLVLLNGRRLSAAGSGAFADISLVPLSAIERVEVLTDGASSTYGSDAVGGVVNIILRSDFEGAESRARYGSVTEGSHRELQLAQTVGHMWDSGNALFSYEYYDRTDLDGTERDVYESNSTLPSVTLLPEQKRQGVVMALGQRLSDHMELGSNVSYARRSSDNSYDLGIPFDVHSDVKQFGGVVGLTTDLAGGWQFRISGGYDKNESEQLTEVKGTGERYARYNNESSVVTGDLVADGAVYTGAGGDVRLAVGAQFRLEDHVYAYASPVGKLDRSIVAAFAELQIPIVSSLNRRSGVEHFDLTLAARYEDYSDFGRTFNPKIGMAWSPIGGINLRGTWGTSFRAPLLGQLSQANRYIEVYERAFPDGNERVTAILLSGNGQNLGPQESTNWTIGVDLSPNLISGLEVGITYFDIDYRRRILSPFPNSYDILGVLQDPQYAEMVSRDPDPSYVMALIHDPRATCLSYPGWSECDPTLMADQIGAIVDRRSRNLAAVETSGVDISVNYGWEGLGGRWNVNLDGTYLVSNKETLFRGAEPIDRLNDVWRPVDLRLRSGLSYSSGNLSATTFLNYIDNYQDLRATGSAGPRQRTRVSSWSTVDITLQYDMSNLTGAVGLAGSSIALSVSNLFDRDPPFIGSIYGLYFDAVNASALGRFVSLQLVAQWGR